MAIFNFGHKGHVLKQRIQFSRFTLPMWRLEHLRRRFQHLRRRFFPRAEPIAVFFMAAA